MEGPETPHFQGGVFPCDWDTLRTEAGLCIPMGSAVRSLTLVLSPPFVRPQLLKDRAKIR